MTWWLLLVVSLPLQEYSTTFPAKSKQKSEKNVKKVTFFMIPADFWGYF
jgi:hypothetical protein